MKWNTFAKPNFTAEMWDYTVIQSPTSPDRREYFHVGTVDFYVGPSTMDGTKVAIYSTESFKFATRLVDLRDKSGTPLFSDDGVTAANAYIGAGRVQMDMFGQVSGYEYLLGRGV